MYEFISGVKFVGCLYPARGQVAILFWAQERPQDGETPGGMEGENFFDQDYGRDYRRRLWIM